MLNDSQALAKIKEALPKVPIKAWTRYKDVYLFRVEFPSAAEKDWDPFFSVDVNTGEVRDFSVLTDGNISEIAKLVWNAI